jgi:DNA invertase Pin-like site-specific DNA recombinase
MSDRPLVVYYRVSTQQQKRSGLGLLAQLDSARRYINANPGRVLAELTEIESGRSKDRPQRTKAAFAAAKARGRKFGNPRPETQRFPPAAIKARVRAERERSRKRALDFAPLLCELRDRGQTINEIAQHLTAIGAERPRGGNAWGPNTVRRMFEHAGERKPKPRLGRRRKATTIVLD